jgi:hypothetical protein
MMLKFIGYSRFAKLFAKKTTPRDVLTREMHEELRRLRVLEEKHNEQIRSLRSENALLKSRFKVYAESVKTSYLNIMKRKMREIQSAYMNQNGQMS